MKKIIKSSIVIISIIIGFSNTTKADLIERALYNVVGQVTNAIGARLGDEIYYGSSRGHVRTTRHHRVRKHKKRKKSKKVVKKIPQMSDQMKIQKALMALGFYNGKLDGEVNSFETRSAIKELNKKYGIGNTASLKPEVKDTLIYLGTLFNLDRTLIASSKDEKTKAKKIQAALKVHGFYHDKIDGLIGKGTRSCISKYKESKGLTPNGKLDFEEEYQLISSAKEKNDKNIEETIASLKALGNKTLPQQQTAQVMQQPATMPQQTVQVRAQQQMQAQPTVTVQNSMQQPQNNQRIVPPTTNVSVQKQTTTQQSQQQTLNPVTPQPAVNSVAPKEPVQIKQQSVPVNNQSQATQVVTNQSTTVPKVTKQASTQPQQTQNIEATTAQAKQSNNEAIKVVQNQTTSPQTQPNETTQQTEVKQETNTQK